MLLLWAGVSGGVFVLFEAIRWGFAPGDAGGGLELLHALRGFTASLASALVTAWFVHRTFRRGLEGRLLGGPPRTGTPTGSDGPHETLLVSLRWTAVFAISAVVLFATLVLHRIPDPAVPLLWLGLAALAAFNLAMSLESACPGGHPAPGGGGGGPVSRNRGGSSRWSVSTQLGADVLTLGWMLHHAGGVSNPFAAFFVFHAAIGSVMLDAGRARRLAREISLWVLALTGLEATGLAAPWPLLDAAGQPALGHDPATLVASGGAIVVMVLGSSFVIRSLTGTLRTERDELVKLNRALEDLTHRQEQVQTQVARDREMLQTVVNCLSDAVIYVTTDGVVRLRNRAAEAMWPREPAGGGDIRMCHPRETWEKLFLRLRDPAKVEPHPVFVMEGRSFEGSYARVTGAKGELLGAVMLARDITDQVEIQRWQRREERLAVVGKLAAGLAHELNNPLGAIALFTQHALATVRPDDPMTDHLGTVLRNANLCKKIVRDLLDYARQRPPEVRDVSLRELLDDVMRTLEHRTRGADIRLVREYPATMTHRVRGDPDQLHQVFVNLGFNAIEAIPAGGCVRVQVGPDGNGMIPVTVRDDGSGIPAEDLERIFQAFHTSKPEGTGLGLTIVRDLVEAHRGEITVESSPGEGSAFTLRLPLIQDRPGKDP